MNHQFQKKVWLGLGLIFAGIVVLGAPSFWLAGKIEKDAGRAALTQASVAGYSRAVAILAELKSKSSEVESYGSRLNALLPGKDDLIEFPKFLEEQGRIRQVSVKFAFQGGAATEPQGNQPGSVGFTLDVTGSYERLKSFFEGMETGSAKFMTVLDSVDMNLSGNEYRVTAQGRAFFK